MRKLRPAELRILKAIPKDLFNGEELVFPGQIHPCNIELGKKHQLNIQTLTNLYKMGLIKHGMISIYTCPIKLTTKGKEILKRR